MAVDVGKSLSEASLSGKAGSDGRWDCAEVETDYPELTDSLCRLLEAEEAKPCSQGTESVTMSGYSRLATGVTQGGSSYHQELSSGSPSGFPRARPNLSETETLSYRATDGNVPLHVRQKFLSSEEQQMFCCQLEELIHWLYNIADIADSWVPSSSDAESIKASLHRYLEFKKDVAKHRSLTESVLERGEALLDCMASNSPALKDTLGLIAKQSEVLETHAEHLYESVLAAAGPLQGKDGMEDKGVQQTAAQRVPPVSDVGFVSQSQDG
ncbi:centrosomal protein of 68 kDa isoform X2 [Phaenicophaeus curvirostris]|uniref:centrosomal protein of 68 kDa isoform X2 n=1 Tax=Phaenicophaeus curvirostris TaxID=33595 RepID=UPI0037F0D526